jgi:Domain of unknown function (DUF6431)
MSIQVSSADTLIEHLKGETKVVETAHCPACERLLWSHGTRLRVCKSLQVCAVIEIKRGLCPNCNKTYSLLPVFIESQKRFERQVSERYVFQNSMEMRTYRELAWQDSESDDAEASVSRSFRAVAEAAVKSKEMLLGLQEHLVERGAELEVVPVVDEQPLAAQSCKSEDKGHRLSYLRRLFCLLKHYFGETERAICRAYRSLCHHNRLSTPHKLQQGLF